ncbi:hypothetical protein PENSPDRAFT_56140 [Peniophora sp. CONT]|nr:hypothetical protein PENSPDRAFT_56140 [Peniophora sp. CONT]
MPRNIYAPLAAVARAAMDASLAKDIATMERVGPVKGRRRETAEAWLSAFCNRQTLYSPNHRVCSSTSILRYRSYTRV